MADAKAKESTEAALAATKPTKPDTDLFNEKLGKLEKEHQDVMAKYNAVKAKIELVTPNKDAPSPTEKRRQDLIAQVNEIRKKQAGGKNTRSIKLDQIKRLDEQLKSRVAEQKAARSKVAFKSAEDLDREIARLEAQVNGGMMKLVDEKKALAEVSNLRKQRKTFASFDDAQKQIDDLRAKIKEIKDGMDDPEAKAMGEQYTTLQTELDAIKAEQDDTYKNLSKLREERTKLQAEQKETFQAIRQLKDEYYAQKKAFGEWEREQRQKLRERHQAERERIAKERKMERAQKILTEASDPAYLEEIRRANSLLHFFDPTHHQEAKSPLLADKGLSAQAQRKVDDAGIKGMKIVSKKDREEEYAPALKKSKKGKKSSNATEAPSKTYNCAPSIMEDCAFLGINPPMSAAEVPAVVEKVKAKLDHWKTDQAAQTQKNVEKAKKEIERLEAEEAGEGGASGAHDANGTTNHGITNGANGVNGKDSSHSKDAAEDKPVAPVAETTEVLKEASLEEKKVEEVAA